MKLVKTIGLAAIAALAAMAFVGAGSASADVLCLGHEEKCEEVNTEPEGTEIHAFSKEARLLSGSIETVCESLVLGKTGKNLGPHEGLAGLIEKLTFTNCKEACEFVTGNEAHQLPYKVIALGLNHEGKFAGLEGILHVFGHELGEHDLGGLLNNCTALNIDCLYGAKEALLLWLSHKPAEGEKPLTPALIHAEVQLLRVSHSVFCPATAEWHGLYEVTKPTGLISIAPLP